VSDELENTAVGFLAALPASVTLPAGAGKTHLLAEAARQTVAHGGRTLILTHTNAGVHAIQRRLKAFGITAGARVLTLTSFGFLLARAYPNIGQLKVPPTPDWDDSEDYIAAAQRIATTPLLRRVLAASYSLVLVDEYQDCSEAQHQLVCALAEAIQATGVLGDPMQAIFGFRGNTLVTWEDIQARFPDHPVEAKPWRWNEHNQPLGEWLLSARSAITPGIVIDFSTIKLPPGVEYRNSSTDRRAVTDAALKYRSAGETTVVISPWETTARRTAADLNGAFTMMEEVAGKFMGECLRELAAAAPEQFATWLVNLTKRCTCGHAQLNDGVKNRLKAGKTTSDLKRPGLEPALAAFDTVVTNPSYESLAAAMGTILESASLRLHSHEAWNDIQTALRGAASAGDDPEILGTELARARDRIRHQGRRNRSKVVSRNLLIKGLEYDHVVIADIGQITDVNNLYVALTRARKTITIVGRTATITVTETKTTIPTMSGNRSETSLSRLKVADTEAASGVPD